MYNKQECADCKLFLGFLLANTTMIYVFVSISIGVMLVCYSSCVIADKGQFISTVVTLIGIILASIGVLVQQSRSRKSLEAQLLLQYGQEYGTVEMCDDVRLLFTVLDEITIEQSCRTPQVNPLRISARIGSQSEGLNNKVYVTRDLDAARRKVKNYFFTVLDFYLIGSISREGMRSLVDKSAITLMFRLIEPMDRCITEGYDEKRYYHLMCLTSDIYQKHKNAESDTDQNLPCNTCSEFLEDSSRNYKRYVVEPREDEREDIEFDWTKVYPSKKRKLQQ